jgi:phosphatidylinositol-4,5-bisphosphate 3-kinase
LRSGTVKWPLWPDDSAVPLQPSLGNYSVGSEGYIGPAPSWFSFSLDSFALPVVYPKNHNSVPPAILTDRYSQYEVQKKKQFPMGDSNVDQLTIQRELTKIIQYDPLRELTDYDRWRVWDNRHTLKANPKALSKFFLSIPYQFPKAVHEAHKLLEQWAPPAPIDTLEFLNFRFGDSRLREYALQRLNNLGDNELADFLLQLTQALKYEPYHDCALSRFLLQRGLRSTHLIGHILFWSLKAEMDSFGVIRERHGLILEEYLRNCGGHRRELLKQNGVVQQLLSIAMLIKRVDKEERVAVLHEQLRKLKKPPKFKLPLSPRMEVKGVLIDKCKVMSSKKLPLWLVFENADDTGKPIYIIFKAGDDLRQDLLTLQLLRVMDKLWKSQGKLDLHMQPYGCVCTGDMVGMIEVVLNSSTVAQIQAGKGGVGAALTSDTPLADWLLENNKKETYPQCVNNFILSCAGYCTATFVLGIGDRHNDNIMLTRNGDLFHIDFGHFLGHYKKKLGIQRETTPFVFTTMYAKVMGGVDTEEFNRWKKLSKEAFQLLRQHGHLIMNLFVLMLATGIPELTTTKEIEWLRGRLVFEYTDEDAMVFFDKQIKDSLGNFRARLMDGAHLAVHYK